MNILTSNFPRRESLDASLSCITGGIEWITGIAAEVVVAAADAAGRLFCGESFKKLLKLKSCRKKSQHLGNTDWSGFTVNEVLCIDHVTWSIMYLLWPLTLTSPLNHCISEGSEGMPLNFTGLDGGDASLSQPLATGSNKAGKNCQH